MKKILGSIIVAGLFSANSFAAQTDENRAITTISSQSDDKGYFRTVEGFSLSCKYNVVYFDLANPSGQGYMSLLLAAKMSGKRITITYEQGVDEKCSVSHVTVL